MTKVSYYMNGKFTDYEMVHCDHRDWVGSFIEAARKAGEPIRQIGPSLQYMTWVTILECKDGSHVKVEGL